MNAKKITIVLLFTVPFLLIGITVWYSSGVRSVSEFSPDDFSRRSYTYNKDPIFGIVLSSRRIRSYQNPVESELTTDGLIKVINPPTQTWHLIEDSNSQPLLPSPDCDARLLTEYLDLILDRDHVWTVWNDDYPKLAPVFWPVVAELARDEMYLKIPDVMEFALQFKSHDQKKFKARLDELTFEAYRVLGTIDFEQNRLARAAARLEKAIQIKADPELSRMLNQCARSLSGSDPQSPEN